MALAREPATANKPRQPSATGPRRASPFNKAVINKVANLRRSSRLRAHTSSPLQSIQEGSEDSANSEHPLSARPRRKRLHDQEPGDSEDTPPAKQPRTNLPSGPPSELSEHNLRLFNGEEMGSGCDNRSVKRSSSCRSTTTTATNVQDVASTRSVQSSGTSAFYRLNYLAGARIYVHPRPPPAPILTHINAILRADISPEQKAQVLRISQTLCDRFAEVLNSASGEDDCIEPLYNVLFDLDTHKHLTFKQKADWRLTLKPRIHKPFFDLSFMGEVQCELANYRPRKRKQQDRQLISPVTSRNGSASADITTKTGAVDGESMAPPQRSVSASEKSSDTDTNTNSNRDDISSPIKTPRPDITIGIRESVLVSSLASRGLTKTVASDFLRYLQESEIQRNEGLLEPVLVSEPTQRAMEVRFPFLIVEGKSYATGKPIYEAQNQAAVLGACAVKISRDLAELGRHAKDSVTPTSSQTLDDGFKPPAPPPAPPLAFLICTEGPVHELWASYDVTEDGVRKSVMNMVKSCHGSIPETVEPFLLDLYRVLNWGSGVFLESVVDQLHKVYKVARGAGVGDTV